MTRRLGWPGGSGGPQPLPSTVGGVEYAHNAFFSMVDRPVSRRVVNALPSFYEEPYMVTKRKEYPRVECEVCKKTYPKVRAWQRFCSDNCRLAGYKSTLERQMKDMEEELALMTEEVERLRARVAELERMG